MVEAIATFGTSCAQQTIGVEPVDQDKTGGVVCWLLTRRTGTQAKSCKNGGAVTG